MIDFSNVQSVTHVTRVGGPNRAATGRKDLTGSARGGSVSADVISISSDAAMKGRVGVFAAALASEIGSVSPERIERLKLEYAGDSCPVSSKDIAESMVARIRMDRYTDE